MAWSRGWRPGLAVLAVYVALAGCALGETSARPAQLSTEQRLRVGVVGDAQSLDPALLSDPLGAYVARNVFGGLYRLDDQLNEIPDIAAGPPRISPDGTTYTFQLRSDARFSNGDPVTAQDFIYSWERVVSLQGPYAQTLSVISGYEHVAQGNASMMTGLRASDAHTLIVNLTGPAGWFPTVISMWWTDVVDRKLIAAMGEQEWWKTSTGLIGTGPFQLTSRTPGQSYAFKPVPNYWRGSPGALSAASIGVEENAEAAIAKYAASAYDILLGGGIQRPTAFLDARVRKDAKFLPDGKTDFVGFNLRSGAFAGRTEGLNGRRAFSLAIDRQAVASEVCARSAICHPATGGLIPNGLRGNLTDDPNAHLNVDLARALYRQWDPDGTKVKGLKYVFESFDPFRVAAESLRRQWKANLGVDVGLEPVDPRAYQDAKNRGSYVMFREGWAADFNHPQNWYQLFRSDLPLDHFGYVNSRYDALVREADGKELKDAMAAYAQAGRLLIDDAAYSALLYGDRVDLIKPHVQGAGGHPLGDYSWTGIRLLKTG